MRGSPRTIGLAVASIVLAAGCSSSPWSAGRSASKEAGAPSAQAASLPATEPQAAQTALADKPDPQALREVMAELQQLGALDPAAQEKLMADLSSTDPAIWPLVVQQFRAAVAYRRRAQQREMATAGPNPVPPAGPLAQYPGPPPSPGTRHPPQGPPSIARRPPSVQFLPPADDAVLAPAAAPQSNYPSTPHPSTDAYTVNSPPPDRQAAEPTGGVVSASYDPAPQGDWQGHVASATRALESQLKSPPQTEQEMNQHARLRMLYLLAGRRDDAVRPIPSLAPALDAFWSAQLYGLSTLLDANRTPDATRRAEETKRILGDAVTWLGEAAPLTAQSGLLHRDPKLRVHQGVQEERV